MSRTLRETTDDILALEELLLESDGEMTPEIEAWMSENAEHLATKVDGYGTLLREWEDRASLISSEIARLTARRRTLMNSSERLKEWLLFCLQRLQEKKVSGTLFTVSRQNNPPSVEILAAPESFPPALIRVVPETVEVDKRAVLQQVKATGNLYDASGGLLARLAAPTESVRIR